MQYSVAWAYERTYLTKEVIREKIVSGIDKIRLDYSFLVFQYPPARKYTDINSKIPNSNNNDLIEVDYLIFENRHVFDCSLMPTVAAVIILNMFGYKVSL